jgi:hypothetical protein
MYLNRISNLTALMDWPALTSAENQQGYRDTRDNPGRAINPSRPMPSEKNLPPSVSAG